MLRKERKESSYSSKSPNRKITHCNWPAFLLFLPLERKRNMLEYEHRELCLLDLHNNCLLLGTYTSQYLPSNPLSAAFSPLRPLRVRPFKTYSLQIVCTLQQSLFFLFKHKLTGLNAKKEGKEEHWQCVVYMQGQIPFAYWFTSRGLAVIVLLIII